MKIRIKATGAIRDCAQDVALILVETGQADILTAVDYNNFIMGRHEPNAPLPYHDVVWNARPGEQVMSLGRLCQYAPVLIWTCQTCHALCYAHPTVKPAEPSVFHFSKHECPTATYEAYLKLFDQYAQMGDRKLKGNYQSMLDAYRQKTSQQLDRKHNDLDAVKNGAVVTL